MKNLIGGFLGTNLIQTGIKAIISGTQDWIKTNAKLSVSLSSLESLTGASTEDLKFYKEAAIDMGSTTKPGHPSS